MDANERVERDALIQEILDQRPFMSGYSSMYQDQYSLEDIKEVARNQPGTTLYKQAREARAERILKAIKDAVINQDWGQLKETILKEM